METFCEECIYGLKCNVHIREDTNFPRVPRNKDARVKHSEKTIKRWLTLYEKGESMSNIARITKSPKSTVRYYIKHEEELEHSRKRDKHRKLPTREKRREMWRKSKNRIFKEYEKRRLWNNIQSHIFYHQRRLRFFKEELKNLNLYPHKK